MFDEKRFKAALLIAGITAKEMAEKLDISESTFYRKVKANGDFTRKELCIMIPLLPDSKDIFFAN